MQSRNKVRRQKILQIGNYPPPMCGWAVQTVLLTEELRRRGHVAQVLNVNESRKIKSAAYVDVQNGVDFLWKVVRFLAAGYRFHVHLNAESPKLYLLDLSALLLSRLIGRPAVLTFHGGPTQRLFPRTRPRWLRWAFQLLFHLAGRLTCDSKEVRQAIMSYGVAGERIAAIPCFSAELLDFCPTPLPPEAEEFLARHRPTFLCYVSFRPEYRLATLREAMLRFRRQYPGAGFIWLGFPEKEMAAAREFVAGWPEEERAALCLLGNLSHDGFLTLLSRCTATVRTPACDGVSASVLESLWLGIPVVASENRRRPDGVLTYADEDPADLCSKLALLMQDYEAIKQRTRLRQPENNTRRTADWITGEQGASGDVAAQPVESAEVKSGAPVN